MASLKKPLALAVAASSLFINQAHSNSLALEEIIVTAQKQSENIQDIPISITALDEGALMEQGISDISGLDGVAPGLSISKLSSTVTPSVSLRGLVSSDPVITSEPAVGIYIDGVYIAKSTGSIFDIAALERIEVLRGPQGTLYGKNTIGGAINLVTKQPQGELGGRVTGTLGNDNLYGINAYLDLPSMGTADEGLGEIMASIAVTSKQRDGFYENTGPAPADELEALDSTGARIALKWIPRDDLEVDYAYDMNRTRNTPAANVLLTVKPGTAAETLGLDQYIGDGKSDKANVDTSDYEDLDVEGHSLTATWDFDDFYIKSISSYRTMDYDVVRDLDGTPVLFHANESMIEQDQFSQELQIVGSTDTLDYVAGIYYFDEDVSTNGTARAYIPTPNNIITNYKTDNLSQTSESQAIFGQVSWMPPAEVFDDRLKLTLGVRYTEEDKAMKSRNLSSLNPNAIGPLVTASETFDNVSMMFSADWIISDSALIYGKFSQGWKAGGFNGRSTEPVKLATPYDEETLDAYELGLKSDWLDGQVRVNASVFYTEYNDLQSSLQNPNNGTETFIENTGEAVMQGGELELLAMLTESLQLSVNYGYIDAEITEFVNEQGVDETDLRIKSYTPANTFNAGARYEFEPSDWGIVTARMDYSFTDEMGTSALRANYDQSHVPSRWTVNGRISLSEIPAGNDTVEVSAWVRNITDERNIVNTIDFQSRGIITAQYGEPRTFGVDVSWMF